MNIGFFADCWDPQVNGVITSMKSLERSLSLRGHGVHKFVPSVGLVRTSTADVFRQPAVKYLFQPEYRLAWPFLLGALKTARRARLALVHSHTEFSMGWMASRIARILGVPHVFTLHTIWEEYSHYFFWDILPLSLLRAVMSLMYKKPDYFIVPSTKIKHYLERTFHIDSPIEIIPTGIDLSHFQAPAPTLPERNAFRRAYGIRPNDLVMIFVGRLGREKSIDVLVKGLARLAPHFPALKLLLVGHGPGTAEVMHLAAALGVAERVVISGYLRWEDIPMAYKASDIFVNASVTETQGLVTVEAMASGLPVALRRDSVHLDITRHGKDGFLFTDEHDFPAMLSPLLSNPGLREQLSSLSLAAAGRYTLKAFGQAVEEYYLRVIEDYGRRG